MSFGSVIFGSVGRWVGGRLVGRSVSKCSLVGGFVKTPVTRTFMK